MILDVTAGNRMIWRNNKHPLGVIFIDKEYGFRVEPDIIADNIHLPIRTDVKIDSIVFDPPWIVSPPPWWLNKKTRTGSGGVVYFGEYESKKDIIPYLHKAHNEFKRYTKRLCLKWGERDMSLWSILGLFTSDGWREIHRVKLNSKRNAGGKSTNQTWWVTLEQSC